jgi:hypothetical protein
MNLLFVNGQVSQARIHPPTRVVIMNSVLFDVDGLVGVAAENALGIVLARVLQSSRRHFRRHAQPARVQPVNETNDRLMLEIKFLQFQIERSAHSAQTHIIHLESVKLMAVNRDVLSLAALPPVILVNANAYQVRHNVGESVVVVAFHPYDFDVAFGV